MDWSIHSLKEFERFVNYHIAYIFFILASHVIKKSVLNRLLIIGFRDEKKQTELTQTDQSMSKSFDSKFTNLNDLVLKNGTEPKYQSIFY